MITNLYNWLVTIIGYVQTGTQQTQNSTIIQLAGFMAVMLFVLCIDLIFNGLFRLFRRK